MHLLYLNNEITSDYIFSVIKRDVLISNLTQVQRYPAALQTLDGSASQWYQYVYIFFCCRAHDIIVAEQKNISMFMWCIEVLQSHTRFISFRLLFLLFFIFIIKILPVFNQGKTACQHKILQCKRINFCWKKNPDLSWY